MIMILNVTLFAAEDNAGKQDADTLPWKIIAENFDARRPFCMIKSEDGKTENFALSPDATAITLPPNIKIPQEQTEAELNLSVWRQDQWIEVSSLPVNIDPNGLTIAGSAIAEGFYNLSVVFDKTNIGKENSFLAIITADWKKDLLGWCKTNKEQIETNPDPELIYSSIAVSHFDNIMELASKSKVLSGDILSALPKAIKAKTDFEDGNCPDLAIGLNKLKLKRFEGAAIGEFAIHIPQEYSDTNKWPVYMHVDPRRWSVGKYGEPDGWSRHIYHEGMLDMWWHTTSHEDLRWKDYAYLMEILKQKLNIDEDRIYLYGLCGNGIEAMALAVKHPDQWAECLFSTGNSYRHLAGNTTGLSIVYDNAHPENNEQSAYMDFAVKCFDYFGCNRFAFTTDQSMSYKRGQLIPITQRNVSPYRVFYTIESLANPSAYWVQIDGREDENFIASIDAIVWGQSILVKTDNVDAYTLNLELAPLDCNRPVEIIENGKFLDSVTGTVFVRKSPKYENALYVKTKSLHGPVSDVFTDRYAVVWKGDDGIKRLAGQLAGSGPCFEDTNLPADFIDTYNIIFVGRLAESNHFSEITGTLPVEIENGKLIANGKVYEGDLGAIFVYPNPLNSQKYLAVFSGTTDKALSLLNSAWGQIKSKDNADVGIFKAGENNKIQWLICEKFNTVWHWYDCWEVPLATLEKEYPKWRWQQWLAKIAKESLKSDVVILEDPFTSEQLPTIGTLTIRDIARLFRNDWMVKVSVKGRELKDVLMVPFKDISARKVSGPVIEGISLVKQPGRPQVLCINELDDEKSYTAAFPYKVINGSRMGVFMKDYRLEGQGFFAPLLKQYFSKSKSINLDNELESMELNILWIKCEFKNKSYAICKGVSYEKQKH